MYGSTSCGVQDTKTPQYNKVLKDLT